MEPAQLAGSLLFPQNIDAVDLGLLLEKTPSALFPALLCADNLFIPLPFT